MTVLHIFYNHEDDVEFDKKIQLWLKTIRAKYKNIHFTVNNSHKESDTDMVNKVYKYNIKSIPAIVLSFDDEYVIYEGKLSLKAFTNFYEDILKMRLVNNVDSVCSNLRNTVSQAIWNNRSDYIENANNAIDDIISLVYCQQESLKVNALLIP
jgi:hypothetical protein